MGKVQVIARHPACVEKALTGLGQSYRRHWREQVVPPVLAGIGFTKRLADDSISVSQVDLQVCVGMGLGDGTGQ